MAVTAPYCFLFRGSIFLGIVAPSEQQTLYQEAMHAIIFTMQPRLIALTFSAVCLYGQVAQKPVVEFEMMTWAEVKKSIHEEGKTTVLVYNGGTEQRGPQNVNGGHNLMARETVRAIALKLGNAITAPVLPFSVNED